jgi:hypothetical protein
MKSLFITFYSDDVNSNYYKSSFHNLEKTFKKFNLELYGEQIPYNREYKNMCLFKPSFILKCLNHFNRNIIWIDADTTLKNIPVEFEDNIHDIIGATHSSGFENIKASPIFLKNSDFIKQFILSWKTECDYAIENNLDDLDHDILKRKIIPIYKDKIKYKVLGNEYCNGYYIENGLSKSISKTKVLKQMKIKKIIK